MKHTLGASALRGLLDATPGAVGCFDANLRAVYANTAFTMTTGVQAGRVLENGPLASEVREMLAGSGAPRRVRIAGERRLPISGTLFALEGNLVGMVLDAGAHEALALLAEEQSALRRVAVLVATSPEPEAVFQAVAEEAGRLLHVRSAATIRYEGGQAWTVGRWADEHDPGGFVVGTSVPLADSDGLTAIVARTGRPARIEDYGGDPRPRRRADARQRLPLRGRRADRRRRAHLGARARRVRRRARLRRRAAPGGLRGARRAGAGERRGARRAQRALGPDPRGRRH